MLDWVLHTSLICLKKDKNWKTCERVILRNAAAKTEIISKKFPRKLYWEMIFFKVVFGKFCFQKSRSHHQRFSIKIADLVPVLGGPRICGIGLAVVHFLYATLLPPGQLWANVVSIWWSSNVSYSFLYRTCFRQFFFIWETKKSVWEFAWVDPALVV